MPTTENAVLPFEPTPEAVDSWLAGLPVGNSRECCRQLYAGLMALNGSGLEPALHCRILERLQPLVEMESGKLMAGFVGKPLPLDERVRKSAKLSAQFQLELARGLQSVVSDERTVGEGERARLVHGALVAYEQYLLRLALMYEPVSSKLWSNVNALFHLAVQWGLDARKEDAIAEVFGRILAFRLACPNRLEQGDVQRLHDLLRDHGGLIDLRSEPAVDGADEFWVDLESSAPPGPVPAQHSASESRRFINTGAFRRQLSLQMQPTMSEEERLNEEFAVRIMVRLGGTPPYSTEQKARQAMVVVGLDSIVGVVAKAERLTSSGSSWTGLGDLELLPLKDYAGAHPRSGASKSAGTFSAESSSRNAAGEPMPEGGIWDRSAGEYPCKVLRADTPGFYLLETAAAALRPARLAALNTDNKLIQVGLVGTARPRGGVNLFVFELLANEVRTVRVVGSAIGAPFTALLARTTLDERFSLLGPPGKLRNGDSLELDSRGRRQSYRITRLLESTAEFTQFELMPLKAEDQEA